MNRVAVTVKVQIVIPSKLSTQVWHQKGTQVYVYERDDEIAIKTDHTRLHSQDGGNGGTKGKLRKALMDEKAKERER